MRVAVADAMRRSWTRPLATVLAIPLLMAGCGGGVGTGGTGTYAAGPITGFGSVIVNDIRFDDGAAMADDVPGGVYESVDIISSQACAQAVVNSPSTISRPSDLALSSAL